MLYSTHLEETESDCTFGVLAALTGIQVQNAWRCLSNPTRRLEYFNFLEENENHPLQTSLKCFYPLVVALLLRDRNCGELVGLLQVWHM